MKASLRWLNEFIDIQDALTNPDPLAQRLTEVGFEVERILSRAQDFKNVVIGEIIERGQHPNADRLTLCKVDVGDGTLRQIVCGAKNHQAKDKVVVALPGAVLPGEFKIQLSKIRDVESQGMLCSESELGLAKESEGILILPGSATVGASFAEWMGFDDVILEVNVTPNRADVFSHFGLARELSVALDRPLKKMAGPATFSGACPVQVTVEQRELCPRYFGLVLKNVKVGPSPSWLKQRLESLDINSVNNVVDVTNWIMLEFGQPLHAFDRSKLIGGEIRVDMAKAKEQFTSFDGSQITLLGTELMIRDAQRPLVIAGIVGGPESGISETTTEVFLEGAYFVPETVRKTSRSLGIETDSAYRFARGTDPEMIPLAMSRALELLNKVSGAELVGGATDFYPRPVQPQSFECSAHEVAERLGSPVSAPDFEKILLKIGCSTRANGSHLSVTPPTYRGDIKESVDLVEEFARLNGYGQITEAFAPLQTEPSHHDSHYVNERRLREALVSEGYSQCVNYAFLNPDFQAKLLGDLTKLKAAQMLPKGELVRLKNPLNEETAAMRMSLLPGLFKNLIHNVRYGVEAGRLFEIGAVFSKGSDHFDETWRVALCAFGRTAGLWESKESPAAIFDLRTASHHLMKRLKIQNFAIQPLTESEVPQFLHPTQSAAVMVEGRVMGMMGTLHPALLASEKINLDAAYMELDFTGLMRGQPRLPRLRSLSAFPSVQRDLVFLVPSDVTAAQVEKVIVKATGALLQSVHVFDQFEGGNLPEGLRSLGFRMILQDPKATLTEDTLQALQSQVINAVSQTLKVTTR